MSIAPQQPPVVRPPRAWADLPLTGVLDRAAEHRREPGALAGALTADGTRVVLVHRGRLALAGGGLDLADAAQVRHLAAAPDVQPQARWLLLGRGASGADVLALVLPDDADAQAPGIEGVAPRDPWASLVRAHEWVGLRDAAAVLGPDDAALATPAVALAAWHGRSSRCPGCGEPTTVTQAGWVRRCDAEGVDHFPRTDPAVIMAVVDADDRLLLGHATPWPQGRYSTLAGYVEPGESLEAAVRREVREETGVLVGDVAYRASQPWPFPASLMLGFRASALTTDVTVDADEVDDARWFTRDALGASVASGDVLLPGRASIARALVEEWFGAPLDAP